MIKRIITFIIIVSTLFLLTFFTSQFILESNHITLSFSLLKLYSFNAVATLVIYILIELVLDYLPNETGYLYLGLMMVKLGVLILLFQKSIFSETGLTKADKICFLIPVLLFLAVEALGISKLLNSK